MTSSSLRRPVYALVTSLLLALVATLLSAPQPALAQDPGPGAATDLPTRVIVSYDADAPQRGNARSAEVQADRAAEQVQSRATLVGRTVADAAVITLDRALDAGERGRFMAELRRGGGVADVEVDQLRTIQQSGDPLLAQQWHYNDSVGGIRLDQALSTTTGSGAVVAILDTGIVDHPDLNANVIGGYDFISDPFVGNDGNGRDADFTDPGDWYTNGQCGAGSGSSSSSWHGSHVAGTVAAVRGNGQGGHGVAPDADLLVMRVLGRCGGFDSDISAAIVWAAGGSIAGVPANPNPADVINMSLGGGGACPSTTQNAINQARALGATVVVAAGNSAINASNATPANCAGVITVAATDRTGGRASYSNFGSTVELAAPGGGGGQLVLSTVNSGSTTPVSPTYAGYQGTSMATPHVAGVAALLYSVDPTLTPDEVATALISSTRAFPATCSGCGSGILDAPAALAALGGSTPPPPPPAGGGVYTFTGPVNIPDRGQINPTLSVTEPGNAPSDLLVSVDIRHTYRGDIRVTLIAPTGASVVLKAPSGSDSADNVIQTWTVNASSVPASGTWTLRVEDIYRGDVGTLNSWSLTF